MYNPKPNPNKKIYEKDWFIGCCIAIPSVLLLAGLIYVLVPKTEFAKVDEITWHYTVQLQQKTILHDAEWGRPWNREVVSIKCERRFYGWEDCHCHQHCTGSNENRRCRRECDRCREYRDWCEYDYVTWPTKQQWATAGHSTKTNWPEHSNAGENQRIVKNESYEVMFIDKDGDKYKYRPNCLSEFKKYTRGGTWMIKATLGGTATPIKE